MYLYRRCRDESGESYISATCNQRYCCWKCSTKLAFRWQEAIYRYIFIICTIALDSISQCVAAVARIIYTRPCVALTFQTTTSRKVWMETRCLTFEVFFVLPLPIFSVQDGLLMSIREGRCSLLFAHHLFVSLRDPPDITYYVYVFARPVFALQVHIIGK